MEIVLAVLLGSFFGYALYKYISYLIGIFGIGHLCVKEMNLGVILGGIIFEIGFGTVGTCTGTCVGAEGSNNFKKSISTIVGGLV